MTSPARTFNTHVLARSVVGDVALTRATTSCRSSRLSHYLVGFLGARRRCRSITCGHEGRSVRDPIYGGWTATSAASERLSLRAWMVQTPHGVRSTDAWRRRMKDLLPATAGRLTMDRGMPVDLLDAEVGGVQRCCWFAGWVSRLARSVRPCGDPATRRWGDPIALSSLLTGSCGTIRPGWERCCAMCVCALGTRSGRSGRVRGRCRIFSFRPTQRRGRTARSR